MARPDPRSPTPPTTRPCVSGLDGDAYSICLCSGMPSSSSKAREEETGVGCRRARCWVRRPLLPRHWVMMMQRVIITLLLAASLLWLKMMMILILRTGMVTMMLVVDSGKEERKKEAANELGAGLDGDDCSSQGTCQEIY